MNKTRIALTAAAVAALAGGGTAIAAKGHTHTASRPLVAAFHPGRPGLDAAATYLGTTVDALRTQLQSGKTLAQIADATSGKSAAGLIAALVADAKAALGANAPADLTQHITDLVNGVHDMHGGPGGPHGGPGGPGLDAAATYLGLTPDALRTQLQSGKTLAQIANATAGKSAAGLIDALVADARTHITALVNGTTH
jgi:hypothetical protein